MEKVDVIIPAYNAAQTIEATLRSVLSQTLLPGQVIVVDDGSDDETGSLAMAMGGLVKVIRQPNGGQGSPRNLGLLASDATILVFLDADDLLLPNALETLQAALIERPECLLAFCRVQLFTDADAPSFPAVSPLDAGGQVWSRLVWRNFIRTTGCVMMRRGALVEAGGWDACRQMQGCEDWDLWLRLAELTPFAKVAEPLLLYRVHPHSFSHQNAVMQSSTEWMLHKHMARRRNALREALRDGAWPVAFAAAGGLMSVSVRALQWKAQALLHSVFQAFQRF